MINTYWHRLFFEERPSIVLSFFRVWMAIAIAVQLTTVPIQLHYQYLIMFVLGVSWVFFLIGFFAQLCSFILIACLYHLYAGIAAWSALFFFLCVMGVVSYHSDYFSIDALRKGDVSAYERKRPFFIQRLLQLQLVFSLLGVMIYPNQGTPLVALFLLPVQVLLWVNPESILAWINQQRKRPAQITVIYDGDCGFCQASVKRLQVMDIFGSLAFKPTHEDIVEMQVIDKGKILGGFDAFRRLCFYLPMLYPFLPFVYLPGVAPIGRHAYRFIASRRHLLSHGQSCLIKPDGDKRA